MQNHNNNDNNYGNNSADDNVFSEEHALKDFWGGGVN